MRRIDQLRKQALQTAGELENCCGTSKLNFGATFI
jgi:hypothetical protein